MVNSIVVCIVVSVLGGLSLYHMMSVSEPLTVSIPDQIQELQHHYELDAYAQLIRYYDEVLTQSARNYAFTQDEQWKQRYFETVPLLALSIKQALVEGSDTEHEFFKHVNSANLILVDYEKNAIILTDNGDSESAISMLQSEEYWNQKNIYEQGLRNYIESRGLEYNEAVIESTDVLDQVTFDTQDTLISGIWSMSLFVGFGIASSLIIGLAILRSIVRPIEKLDHAVNQITSGKSDIKIENDYSYNEFSKLIASFNLMFDAINENIKLEKELAVSRENLKKEKLETIGLMSSSLSHNLRNPLSVIKLPLIC